MLSSALASKLSRVGAPLGPLATFGIHIDQSGQSFLDVGRFAEQCLSWAWEILGQLFNGMLGTTPFPRQPMVAFHPREQLEWNYYVALCGVGDYPLDTHATGISATPASRARLLRTIYRHLPPKR